MNNDRVFMSAAIELARQSALEGEVPVGAVIVRNGEIVATGRNRRETGKNALSHAEIQAIDRACRALGGWRLFECEMFVTLEPCPMCAGAVINSRIKRVVFGAYDKKAGSFLNCRTTIFPRSRAALWKMSARGFSRSFLKI